MNLQNHLPGILFLKILLYLLSDLADHSLLFLFPDYRFQLDQAFLFLYDHFHLLYLAQFFLCLPAFLSLSVLHSVPFDQCYFLYLPVFGSFSCFSFTIFTALRFPFLSLMNSLTVDS